MTTIADRMCVNTRPSALARLNRTCILILAGLVLPPGPVQSTTIFGPPIGDFTLFDEFDDSGNPAGWNLTNATINVTPSALTSTVFPPDSGTATVSIPPLDIAALGSITLYMRVSVPVQNSPPFSIKISESNPTW
jgi:hypothetical protein